MRRFLKWFLGGAAVLLIGVCFMYGLMAGVAEQQRIAEEKQREECKTLPWPRPAVCAYYSQEARNAH